MVVYTQRPLDVWLRGRPCAKQAQMRLAGERIGNNVEAIRSKSALVERRAHETIGERTRAGFRV